MAKDQSFKLQGFEKQVVYFMNALPVDDFDLAIRQVPGDRDSLHAKVELVFYQDKGSNKTEVVAAVRMHLYELDELIKMASRKRTEFLK